MTEQLMEIGMRLRALREIMEVSADEMAEACHVTPEQYLAYEDGKKDFSYSFLHNAAARLGVEDVELMSGDTAKLGTLSIVRKGEGLVVQRRAAYKYRALAHTFRNKKADPFLVTVYPANMPEPHGHEGQEFQYLLEGEAQIRMGDQTIELHAGDAVYFDSSVPHALRALNDECAVFLAVVINN